MLQRQPAYVSRVHPVERINVRERTRMRRSRTDFVVLYVLAAVAGMACGFLLTVVA